MITETAGTASDDDRSDRRLALLGRFVPRLRIYPLFEHLVDFSRCARSSRSKVELRHAAKPVNQPVQIAAFVEEVDDVDSPFRFAKNDEMPALATITESGPRPLALHQDRARSRVR